ncbi:type III restriction enzyme [Variovorax paradoxus]|uniref:DEAD/DEAH box helicase family protein n=1 Tax=Variovorax atrisoli TaxID=3394203 RepID=UPI00119B58B1|nr:DEAD/DEAH box helicase family protein [Variovorax paradoxus]MDR6523853.1 type III restriction enzyme [Variovorax paradoxus]
MLELKVFQTKAAKLIADRYSFYASHADRPRKGSKPRAYFQALKAITGSGKTPILAQAVAELRTHLRGEPIVFWMSKAKSVVAQTYANFSAGGKYSHILDDFNVINVGQLSPQLIEDGSAPLMIMATTGLFNNKDQSEGALNIYKTGADGFGEKSPWQRLIDRQSAGKRRPLLIVYDEAHNLSEQQVDILAELEPEAYLVASATLRFPPNFHKQVIQHMASWAEESDGEKEKFGELLALDPEGEISSNLYLTTTIPSDLVVEAQLVKRAIQFDGTTQRMERCLDDLMQRLGVLQSEIDARGLAFRPKAIYVCKTNIADDGERDNPNKPFEHREAPPIRIWRYLVNDKGVDPKDIAVYADLNFVEGNKPSEFNLFSRKDSDFDEFTAGDYQHIIFNLSLQEGWDDPACYLAYIDKSMGSTVQVEQVIGRALRQYGATHYDSPLLNSAHFFIRVDGKEVFVETLNAVREKLESENSPIAVIDNYSGSGSKPQEIEPKEGETPELCQVNVDAEDAIAKIAEIVDVFPAYAAGSDDTMGTAHSGTQILDLKNLPDDAQPTWEEAGHTNPVRLRWLANTAIKSLSTRALAVTDLGQSKFDIKVEAQSKANKQAEKMAREVVSAYYERAELDYDSSSPFVFKSMRVGSGAIGYKNALYEKYAGLNAPERAFAATLDESGHLWHRNPVGGGFHIPLLSEGDTASFYPDFIVWKGKLIYCIDTKGKHLLTDAVARKLFDIKEDGKTKILVRLVVAGRQNELRGKTVKGGFTVWKMKTSGPAPIHVGTLEDAVKESLK